MISSPLTYSYPWAEPQLLTRENRAVQTEPAVAHLGSHDFAEEDPTSTRETPYLCGWPRFQKRGAGTPRRTLLEIFEATCGE